ncbi:DegT/DnrJ/EryC1/StrS family aminotransferase [Candidatus Pacearchaeota archaeon]|nr:DegT/DnrJ/EryC1/StrS family aminotransferase [Candidatus Pacearchaeota archaeon]
MEVPYVNIALQYKGLEHEILPVVKEVLKSGSYILGKELNRFEHRIAGFCRTRYAIGVANGTDALRLSLHALNIGRDDEVITAPNSFIASAGAIAAVGAKPVFVDVGEDYNINSELIENAINERTNYRGRRTGSLGDVGCFSTHPLKTLHTAGDGGFITTDSQEIYERIIKLRNHGLKNREESEFFGYNSRLDEIHAAILNTQLEYVEIWNKQRRDIALRYSSELSPIVDTPEEKSYEESSYHTFVIQAKNRDSLRLHLSNMGIETKIHYPIPIHLQQAAKYLGYRSGAFPVAERQSSQILSLPVYPELTSKQIEKVIEGVTSFYK